MTTVTTAVTAISTGPGKKSPIPNATPAVWLNRNVINDPTSTGPSSRSRQ